MTSLKRIKIGVTYSREGCSPFAPQGWFFRRSGSLGAEETVEKQQHRGAPRFHKPSSSKQSEEARRTFPEKPESPRHARRV